MWIDYQLHIYFIYIYIFLFSRSLARVAHSHIYPTCSHLFIFFVYNITNVVTGLKLQSPKTNSENRGGREEGEAGGGTAAAAAVCCPSLTDAAQRTQSA